jgi:hypothetical protein
MVVPDNQDGLWELKTSIQLFAYLGDQYEVLWNSGNRCMKKEEFFSYFLNRIPAFQAAELLPHWPAVPGVLYHHRPVPPVTTGVIDELLDFFSPATPHDRQLLKALLLTLFWGGAGGQRPMFVLTHPPRTSPTQGRDTGRGIGKTTVCELMASLCGGYVDISGSARSEDVEKRLLSPTAYGKRMVRFDNIKSSRFACEDFERMITSSTLSGRRLYVGEGQRPNLLTYVLTMNGVALGDDLASRSVVIHLERPAHRARWREEVEQFIERHRWELIADIGSLLEAPPTPLSTHSRFGAWGAAVLSKLENPDELATLIRERSQQIDVDRDTAEMIEHEFRARCGSWISATEPITIGSTEASEIIFAVTGEKIPANRLRGYFERIGFSGVRYRRTNRRGEWVIPRQFPERSGTPQGPAPSGPVPGINGPSPEPPTMTGE